MCTNPSAGGEGESTQSLSQTKNAFVGRTKFSFFLVNLSSTHLPFHHFGAATQKLSILDTLRYIAQLQLKVLSPTLVSFNFSSSCNCTPSLSACSIPRTTGVTAGEKYQPPAPSALLPFRDIRISSESSASEHQIEFGTYPFEQHSISISDSGTLVPALVRWYGQYSHGWISDIMCSSSGWQAGQHMFICRVSDTDRNWDCEGCLATLGRTWD